ncbi:MAG: hypothetical protein INF18_10985 [Methylobacterium sp.]|nr:hypothetical protein [Methylobacterium sp.]MCA3637281.1 hypothetical protein [Methylobacterium sp.]
MAGKKLAIARHPHRGKQFGSTPLERFSRAKGEAALAARCKTWRGNFSDVAAMESSLKFSRKKQTRFKSSALKASERIELKIKKM